MDKLEKILFREPLTGQEFVATREDLVSSFLELSLMLRDPENNGFVTINDLITILNKKIGCKLKTIVNEFDFVWYRSLLNDCDLIEAETVHALSLDNTKACERIHYISRPLKFQYWKVCKDPSMFDSYEILKFY